MSFVISSSLLPVNGAEAIFFLKQALVNAGWSVISSSNGTVLTGSDIFTSGAVIASTNAYFIIKQPSAATSSHGGFQREFGFQRVTANTSWRVSYTVSSSHVSGGTATLMPTGSDRKWCFEGTTYQAGNAGTLFTTDGTYRLHIYTDTSAPYGFYAVSIPTGGGFPNCIIFDPMLSGSYAAGDPDPTVQWFQGDGGASTGPFLFSNANGSNVSNQTTASNATPRGWLAKTTTTESYSGFQVPLFGVFNSAGSFFVMNSSVGTNHTNTMDNFYPIFYLKPNNAGGSSSVKGISSLFSGSWIGRGTGDVLSITSIRDKIVFRHFIANWNGTTPAV